MCKGISDSGHTKIQCFAHGSSRLWVNSETQFIDSGPSFDGGIFGIRTHAAKM